MELLDISRSDGLFELVEKWQIILANLVTLITTNDLGTWAELLLAVKNTSKIPLMVKRSSGV